MTPFLPLLHDGHGDILDHCTNIRLVRTLLADNTTVTYLHANLKAQPGRAVKALNLDEVLWSYRGRFYWRAYSSGWTNDSLFDASRPEICPRLVSQIIYIDVDGDGKPDQHHRMKLHARLFLPDGTWLDSEIDLDECVVLDQTQGPPALMPNQLPRARTIVMCFDGTGNQYGDTNTNVVYLMRALQKADPSAQQVYYQDGIGTYVEKSWRWGQFTSPLAKTADQAIAWGLADHVKAGYKFLVNSYKPGDKICVFGFSRGAHTARAVVSMVAAVGLLPAHNEEHIPFAYDCYRKAYTPQGSDACRDFCRTFSEKVKIHFVGLWDTVNSTGALWPTSLPGTDENPQCKFFRHALSLDERRVRFKPSVGRSRESDVSDPVPGIGVPKVKQVWFAGNHCDVGGGNRPNTEGLAIANIPLRWMIKQCFECQTDVLFKGTTMPRNVQLPDLIEHAARRKDSVDSYLREQRAKELPFNMWPKPVHSAIGRELKDWPRASVIIDSDTGAATYATGEHARKVDMLDVHTSLRHDVANELMWIWMEWTPTLVRRSVAAGYSLDDLDKAKMGPQGVSDKMHLKQEMDWVINRGRGREVYPEADGKFYMHESVRTLYYKRHDHWEDIVESPTDMGAEDGYRSSPKKGDTWTARGNNGDWTAHAKNGSMKAGHGVNGVHGLDSKAHDETETKTWTRWLWSLLGYEDEDELYACKALFCVSRKGQAGLEYLSLGQLMAEHAEMVQWEC